MGKGQVAVTIHGYEGLDAYFGDIHNHCAVGYGHGSLEDAFTNARLQLDFACVTPHAVWPDMPQGDPRLSDVVAYHQMGFERAARLWPHVQDVVESAHQDGRFVSLLGFEWHSLRYGDHNVYYKGSRGAIIPAVDLEDMRQRLRRLAAQGVPAFLIPHHIGYKQGYRGINWATYTPEFSPVVEIFSMHGASESDSAPYPYMHTMGPRDLQSTYQYGLSLGHVVGAVGSTDHHSGHPGSYGHGRLGVWASELTRDGIWDALAQRRTVALTGDNIRLMMAINGQPLGSVLPPTEERQIEIEVIGGDALDVIELVYNNQVIERWCPLPAVQLEQPVKVYLEVGWGEREQIVDWDVNLEVFDGTLLAVEPRFRGRSIVAPEATEDDRYTFSEWARRGSNGVQFHTRTWGNPTNVTPNTQGICLEIEGSRSSRIQASFNGHPAAVRLSDLRNGSQVGYLGDFLTPAYCFHRAVPRQAYVQRVSMVHHVSADRRDWYYARVGQKNGQWAWSSPIWVGASTG